MMTETTDCLAGLIDLFLSLWRTSDYSMAEFCGRYDLDANLFSSWLPEEAPKPIHFLRLG